MCQIILALEEAVSTCHQKSIPSVETEEWFENVGTRARTSSSVCGLSQTKIKQRSISTEGCRGMGVEVLVPWANLGPFGLMCMWGAWQSAVWTNTSRSSLFCREMPTRICVDLRKLGLCVSSLVQSTVCTMYYKIDLSVNDADLYHGAVCLERTPWGDILHRVDNTEISVICVWYFWLRKG